jgi:hypothetical protein
MSWAPGENNSPRPLHAMFVVENGKMTQIVRVREKTKHIIFSLCMKKKTS